MTLAPYVRIVAQGKGRARSMDQQEAREAMSLMLSGEAEAEAIGALLMVLRLRGETDAEIAGFTAALRQSVTLTLPKADLDWPCYAAGRTRGAPMFLLSAKLVAEAGYTVLLHGWNARQNSADGLPAMLENLGILGGGLHYEPLDALSLRALELLQLRDTFGLRSCINTILRMWNPSGANASVQGVFHPSYRGLQSRAGVLLGDKNLTVIKGGGGEFERNPSKPIEVFGLQNGNDLNLTAPALITNARRLHDPDHPVNLTELCAGKSNDPFAVATITGTAALALWSLGAAPDFETSQRLAEQLWHDRKAKWGKIV
ncbi:MAG: glycosyl transferase family protein [Litoreibacter sp.]